MARSTSWVFMAFGPMGVNGGVALSRSRLALRSNDGIALCQAERSATANWAPADWAQAEMDPVPDANKVQDREMPARQLSSCWLPGGGPARQEWQRAADQRDEGARATAHQTAPARPKSAYPSTF